MTKAIYAFSGDPITYGHIDIVKRAASVFDELIVAIGVNPDKSYTFSLKERELMAQKSLGSLANVRVVSFQGLLVDYAYENKIPIVIKGLRDEKDFDYEMILHEAGRSQKQGIDTFLLPAKAELKHISSSMVKSLQKEQGIVHEYVPLNVKQQLEEKISGQSILGITGEIGAGKSYLAQKFVEFGKIKNVEIHNIDLDAIGHKILEDLTEPVYLEAREKIVDVFGSEIREENGTINRKKLGEIVFSDSDKLKTLNNIMHELILVRLRRDIYGKKGLILMHAALFAETNMMYLFNNNTILVHTSADEQKKRLLSKGLDDEQIQRRIDSQFNTDEKRKIILSQQQKDHYGKLWDFENIGENLESAQKLFDEVIEYFSK